MKITLLLIINVYNKKWSYIIPKKGNNATSLLRDNFYSYNSHLATRWSKYLYCYNEYKKIVKPTLQAKESIPNQTNN